jgi:FkbM family methyltransferase
MQPFKRLLRKIRSVRQYPALAFGARDRRELWLLGLVRNRVFGARAARLLLGDRRLITPRLALTRGEKVRVQLDRLDQVDVFDEIFLTRIYDVDAVDFAPALVVDCGAYCGYFSALAAGAFPRSRIVCFEANPANLPVLEAQLALLVAKVELRAEAVYVLDGTMAFSGGGIGGGLVEPDDPLSLRRVACIDFPRWLRESSPSSLVLKLDVEGAEAGLLPATLDCLPRRTTFFLETHHTDAVCEALLAPYREAGFDVREIRRRPAKDESFSYIEWLLTRKE